MEIVERTEKTLDEHLDTAFRGLVAAVSGFDRCFIDTRELTRDDSTSAAEVFRRAAAYDIPFTPVTGISRTADVTAALAYRTLGLALRLRREEYNTGRLAEDIRAFLDRQGLVPEEVDLIIDLGAVDDMIAEGVEAFATAFLADVPDHTRWKTFTLSASAFPLSMAGVDRYSYALIERADWMAWRDGLHARRATLQRLPTYSDCAIQHPKGVEGFDPRTMQMSASVRYASGDSWVLIKGESTRRAAPSMQYPLLARRLVYGDLTGYYRGADHCDGCAGMFGSANGIGGFGSAEAWRRLGTIHHVTTVVQDLGGLPWP